MSVCLCVQSLLLLFLPRALVSSYTYIYTVCVCNACYSYIKLINDGDDDYVILQRKCGLCQLPGNEVYRKQDQCVFEIDGSVQVNFCRTLSQLGQFFCSHASLLDDPTLYVYYVLYRVDQTNGFQFIGFTSKVRQSTL